MKKELYQEQYDLQKKHWWFAAKKAIVISELNALLKNKKPVNILDAGCGTGLMLPDLNNIGPTSGMDFSLDAIGFAKKMYGGTIKQCCLPDDIPYDDNTFEVLISLDVIEHVEDDLAALKSLRKRIIKGGVGIFTVPALMSLWSHHDVINEHKRRYDKEELEKKLVEAGYVVEKISYYNTLLFPMIYLVRLINRVLKKEDGSDVELPSPVVNSILKIIFEAEKFLLKFMRFPIGASLIASVRNPEEK